MSVELSANEIITHKQPFDYDNLLEDLNKDLSNKVSNIQQVDCANNNYISSMTALELEYNEYLKKDQ